MKRLQDIITESILDDNIGDDSIVPMFFNNLMDAKNPKEFNNMVTSLKSYLDDEIGDDYTRAYKMTKRDRSGHYLAILNFENSEDRSILVSSGPSQTTCVKFYNSTQKVFILKYNLSIHDLLHNGYCVYKLDDKWNELRKMIINRK